MRSTLVSEQGERYLMNKTFDCVVLSAFVIALVSLSGVVGTVIVTILYLLCGECARQLTKLNHPHPWKYAAVICYMFGPASLVLTLLLTAVYEFLIFAGENES